MKGRASMTKRTLALAVAIAAGMTVYTMKTSAQPAGAPANPGAAAPSTQQAAGGFGSPGENASYGFGYDIGRQMKESKAPIDAGKLMQGLQDALADKPNQVPPEAFQAAVMQIQQEMMAKQEVEMAQAGAQAGEAGTAYRAENAKKEGVKSLPSGLQIQMTNEGKGDSPAAEDTVKVHYTGTLINGEKFDSSVDRGEPAEFPLNGVIKGWTEGLQLLKPGGKARLVIPPDLGYGPRGAPPRIPPNATLVFDVELISVQKAAGGASTQPAQ
jgi:FKBP-type peptidyl-prolyl cis-trans isomerase